MIFGVGGINIRYKLNEYLFFQPEFSFLYGRESITELISTPASYNLMGYATSFKYSENKIDRTVLGAHLEQHVFLCPAEQHMR